MMRTLSLFSGIGGFELAAAALNCFTVEQLVEIDEDAQYVLRQHYPHIPIHSDIRTFYASKSTTKGRIRARYLFAKTVMPGQAYIALKRVQHLAKTFGIID
jgi:site-specific DNA-cytosine methylase